MNNILFVMCYYYLSIMTSSANDLISFQSLADEGSDTATIWQPASLADFIA